MFTMFVVFQMSSIDPLKSVMSRVSAGWEFHNLETSNCPRHYRSSANVVIFTAHICPHAESRVSTLHIFTRILRSPVEAHLPYQVPKTGDSENPHWKILCRIQIDGNKLHPCCMEMRCPANVEAFHVTHSERNCKVPA